MKKGNLIRQVPAVVIAIAFSNSVQADPWLDGNAKLKVQPVVPFEVHAFPLEDVRLLDGPFKHAMELDKTYLLSLDTDRLLRNFRVNAGLPTSAQPLGGWEAPSGELRGHFVGHYLSACAMMYASTGDPRLKEKGDAIVAGLAECQAKLGSSGYLSAFPESFIDRVEKQQPVWAPYYTLHKIFAGLEDMYVYCDNQQALDVAKKFGDWVIARNSRLTDAQMQAMLETEHGGMNETLANLYALTGEKKYLEISLRFNHHRVLDPAERREDKLTGLHANTQIPKFIGVARQYELTGEEPLKTAATFFWDTVVSNRSYVIGGNSDGEHFTPTNRLSQMGPNTTETCNTYNMLKLTRHLFCWEPVVRDADYFERALYNHILASQNPETGMMCYYVPLRAGSQKTFNTPTDSFWCCTGTGVENHSKYGDSIYFHDDANTLYVNLFIASQLNWKAKGLQVRQETTFPDLGATKLTFQCAEPVKLAIRLRHPSWATKDFAVRLNGSTQRLASQPGAWVTLDRTWKNGDTVEISMPFSLHTESFEDNPSRFAFLNGPLVLAAPVKIGQPFPVVVASEERALALLKPVAGSPNTFRGPANTFRIPGNQSDGVTLEPFYRVYDRHYEVYWDSFSPEQWKAKQQAYEAEQAAQRELEARTVDYVKPGEEQNERDHNLRGEKTNSGDFGERKYRDASNGGWFSWDLKVLAGQPQELVLTYWGEDRGRHFDVFADGEKLRTQRLTASHPGKFFDATYPLSPELTQGKDKITVKIQGPADSMAGGVFGVRVLKTPIISSVNNAK